MYAMRSLYKSNIVTIVHKLTFRFVGALGTGWQWIMPVDRRLKWNGEVKFMDDS